ncbi:MAG: HAMP domain-containing protein [Clostridia bacterium]|nr:HAMP domain-containing protein [Clostridia bacterium]
MFKKLQFKIVLIMIVFITLVMAVIGTTLLNNLFSYFSEEFNNQLDSFFDKEHMDILSESLESANYVESLKNKLNAYSSFLGIDPYRSFFILDAFGGFLESNSGADNKEITVHKTPNLISAINNTNFENKASRKDFIDYAVRLDNGERTAIIYIVDTQEEVRSIANIIFNIIIQALLIGSAIALILSFLLSKVISSPIQKITATATLISDGDLSQRVEIHSADEIGILAETFNTMALKLKSNLDEITGEREKLSTIFSYLKDGVIAFNSYGEILHINQTAIDLLKDTYSENISLPQFISLLNIDYSDKQLVKDTSLGDGKVFYNINFGKKFIDINFGSFSFELSGRPYIGYIVVIHDVTEHFELELARREFVANVSHELRTPLTGIKGAAETIMENPDIPPELSSHFLEMIITESDRMTRIVHDLLMLSRLDNNRVSWKLSSFSPLELMNNRVEIMQHEARSHNQQLIVEKEKGAIPDITGDREKIDQVLTNVIQNALKYTQDNGTVTVSISFKNLKSQKNLKDGQYVVLKVEDNGIGIPKDDIPHIFERFYRVEKARSSEKGGTGLGLAISKDIVNAHGGDITISSVLEKGTCVNIYLPLQCSIKE